MQMRARLGSRAVPRRCKRGAAARTAPAGAGKSNPHLIHLSTGTHIMKNARPEAVLQARNEKMTLRRSAASIGSSTHAIDAGPTRLPCEKPHLARRNDALTRSEERRVGKERK